MCKHYTAEQHAQKYGAAYAGVENPPEPEHTEIWPKRKAHVVTKTKEGRNFPLMRWGVWPFYSREKPQFLHNARDDSLLTKATWKKSVANRRCLIPASAYFEPGLGPEGTRGEVRLTLINRPVFFVAGLWDTDPDGSGNLGFTMVTTTPNDYALPFQDRMPVILDDEGAAMWLGDEPLTLDTLTNLCRACPSDIMQHVEIAAPTRPIKKADLQSQDGELRLF